MQIIGEKDADGFYWGECGGRWGWRSAATPEYLLIYSPSAEYLLIYLFRSGYVPCNMVSEVQVDDERVARELLKDDQRMRGGRGWRGGDRCVDITSYTIYTI